MRLGDEEPPAFIDAEGDRVLQQRLGGDEFDLQAGGGLELLELGLGGGVGGALGGAGEGEEAEERSRRGEEADGFGDTRNPPPDLGGYGRKHYWLHGVDGSNSGRVENPFVRARA